MYLTRAVLLGLGLSLGACSASGRSPETPQASTPPTTAVKASSPMQCDTRGELERAWDTSCRVIGTYRMQTLTDKKGQPFRTWPVVVLDDGAEVLIGSIWKAAEKPSDEASSRHDGQRVRVTGTLNAEPPGSIQNIAIPCISPVEDIESMR